MTAADAPPGARDSWKADAWRIGLVLLFAVGVRAVMVANTTVVSRDCVKFVRDALHLEQPPAGLTGRLDVIRNAEYPPGYPAAILAVSWLVRPLAGGTTVEAMALSAQLASALAGVLLVIPLYALVRRVLDRNAACSAALIFTVLPVCVEVTSDGISDGLFLLTAVTALWFGVRALEQRTGLPALGWGFGAGACCGLGFLVRPDAAIVALGTGLTFAGLVLARIRNRGAWLAPLLAGVGLVAGAVLFAAPYVRTIGGLTNKPGGRGVVDAFSGEEPDPVYFRRDEARLGAGAVPIAAWWDPVAFKDESKPVWAFKNVIYEYLKTGHYTVPVFAAIGLFALRRRLTDPRLALLLTVAVVKFGVLWVLAWKIGYVSQRSSRPTSTRLSNVWARASRRHHAA
jgi:4-amino-4-deoxy-L-arabinose transferase-like glycosyltransferase